MRFKRINKFKSKNQRLFLTFLLSLLLFSSCATTKNASSSLSSQNAAPESELSLLFAGDVMAHAPNYKITDFDRIWRDIRPLVSSSDLAFANIEAPVANDIPWNTYPQFNMHTEYVEAAIKAGFNVFSLTNNHTNDQYLDGIKQTKKYFDNRKGIWACGLKEKSGGPLTYKIIHKNGWKILFVSITELLNRNDFASYIDYYPSKESKRNQLIEELKKLQEESKADLFVLSVHTDEPEYVIKVTESHKKFFRRIIEECRADIIWANHPHVVKIFEETAASSHYTQDLGQRNRKAFIMYANGNTISAQRTNPQFAAPDTPRDYTGEGLLLKLKARKMSDGSVILSDYEPHLITTYITPAWQFVIKLLDDDFIATLDRAELVTWAKYLTERKKLMEKVLEGK
ncbi:CapA family protein [uncultured Treponema sp.]|uniref:CapA family protein n=1 Tax=uncultured Treponema sp. TaxID=162155 RepID=UPI00261B6C59|nr:CapA family protein [uncultured Treponema sp.]